MKTIKKTIGTAFILMLLISVYASSPKWLKGYIVTLDKDTIHGILKYSEYANGCSCVKFQEIFRGTMGNKLRYNSNQLLGFKRGDEVFETKQGRNHPVFMKRLINGQVKLFTYSYNVYGAGPPVIGHFTAGPSFTRVDRRSFYYLERHNGEATTVKHLSFKKEMTEYFKDCPEVVQKVDDNEYKNIEQIVEDYNKCIQSNNLIATEY